jgi:hypothetical protein
MVAKPINAMQALLGTRTSMHVSTALDIKVRVRWHYKDLCNGRKVHGARVVQRV